MTDKLKIMEKLTGVLTEGDLAEFEKSVDAMIAEGIKAGVAEESKRIALSQEETYKAKLEESIAAEKLTLSEAAESDKKAFEEKIVDKLDKFIESEVAQNISESAIRGIALNETYKPIIEAIMETFEQKFVALDTEGHGILKEANDEIANLEERLSSEIAEKVTLKESLEKVATKILIDEKTTSLSVGQKARVSKFFEGKDYTEVENKISDFVSLVLETRKEDAPVIEDKKVNEDVTSSKDITESVKETVGNVVESVTSRANDLI